MFLWWNVGQFRPSRSPNRSHAAPQNRGHTKGDGCWGNHFLLGSFPGAHPKGWPFELFVYINMFETELADPHIFLKEEFLHMISMTQWCGCFLERMCQFLGDSQLHQKLCRGSVGNCHPAQSRLDLSKSCNVKLREKTLLEIEKTQMRQPKIVKLQTRSVPSLSLGVELCCRFSLFFLKFACALKRRNFVCIPKPC